MLNIIPIRDDLGPPARLREPRFISWGIISPNRWFVHWDRCSCKVSEQVFTQRPLSHIRVEGVRQAPIFIFTNSMETRTVTNATSSQRRNPSKVICVSLQVPSFTFLPHIHTQALSCGERDMIFSTTNV